MQRYNFESNSQRNMITTAVTTSCCYWCKDTILKAIHNSSGKLIKVSRLLLLMQRYNFESNSQHGEDSDYINEKLLLLMQRYNFESNSQLCHQKDWVLPGCCYWCKDTILFYRTATNKKEKLVEIVYISVHSIRTFLPLPFREELV